MATTQTAAMSAAVDQILKPASKPPFHFAFDTFLKREYQFGAAPNPDRHTAAANPQFVCKHWLRGLCKKGDQCDYVHEYNMRAHGECPSYARLQQCPAGDDCLLLHVDPDMRRPACPHYERGFCPLGPYCANQHVRKPNLCRFYLAGFCSNGRGCPEGAHARFPTDLKKPEAKVAKTAEELEQERLEREAEMEREVERNREYQEERAGLREGGGGAGRDRFRGGWKKRGGRGRGRGDRRGGF